MKKRILAMLLALVMVISLVPIAAMAAECDHTYDQYTPTTLGKHNWECSKCGDILIADAHCKENDADYDGTCDRCNTMYKHEHDSDALLYNNANTHFIICSKCEEIQAKEGHKWSKKNQSVNKDKHAKVCSACGAQKDVNDHKDNDGDQKCDQCGLDMDHVCNFEAGITPNLSTNPNVEKTHNINCVCGNYVEIKCSDADGDRFCDSCKVNELYKELPKEEHQHSHVAHPNNDGTHNLSCNCGALTQNVVCSDDDNDGYCDNCKYWVHKCDFEAGIVSDGKGSHVIYCSCGNSMEFTCMDYDGDTKCDSCGYVKYVHECEGGAWTSNNDGTHSSKCSCGKLMDGPNACQTINGKTCYMCGYVMFKCDHKNMVTDVTKEPTCTEDGYKMSKCPDCGDTSEGKIFAKGHDFQNGKCTACGISNPDCQHPKGVEKYTPATCTDAGSHSFWCPECNFEKMEILPALEHMKVEKIEAATCTSEGKIHVVCRRCDELLLEKVLPVRDHVKIDKSYPATCTEDGLEHVVCSVCDQILRDEVIPAGHKFEDGHCTVCENACNHENGVEEEVAATCTSEGSHTFVCPDCNLEKKEVYPALGHVEKEKDQEPTCTQPGVHHVVCTRCNKLLVEKELPVVAHKYENGKCAVCGTSEPNYVEPSTPIDPIIPEEPEDTKTEEKNNWLTLDLFGFHIVGNAGK